LYKFLSGSKNSNFIFGVVLMSAQVHSQICPYLITHAKLVPAWKLASVGIIASIKKFSLFVHLISSFSCLNCDKIINRWWQNCSIFNFFYCCYLIFGNFFCSFDAFLNLIISHFMWHNITWKNINLMEFFALDGTRCWLNWEIVAHLMEFWRF